MKKTITKICLVDRFLIFFILILFLYTAINLLIGSADTENANTVNTIVRTSSAAIFGYFISSNFNKRDSDNTADNLSSDSPIIQNTEFSDDSGVQLKNPLGFETSSEISEQKTGKVSVYRENDPLPVYCGKIQIIIVSSIGIGSLILLFIIRYSASESHEIAAIVSQLRDFVSACIGFLVSYKKT